MSIRAIVVSLLAIICGVSAAIGAIKLRQTSPAAEVETVPVIVAKMDIARGNMVTADMLETRDWPKTMAPKHAISQLPDAVDRAAAVPILAGDVVSEGKLASRDAGRGIAALVPPGMRAYTVQTAKIAANVAGFVLPGNRVDVLLTLRSFQNDETGGGSTTTLLQAVEILAVNQQLDAPAENKMESKELQSVTLLVSPDQAELLDLGQNLGQLTLSLRNLTDTAQTSARAPATLAQLRSLREKGSRLPAGSPDFTQALKPAQDPRGSAPAMWKIRTLRGSSPGEIAGSSAH